MTLRKLLNGRVRIAGALALASAFAGSAAVVATPVTVIEVREPDRGGSPGDGDLWRRGTTVALGAEPGATLRRQVIANTPIPDSPRNRALYGAPLSASGRLTAAEPGPTARARVRAPQS